MSIGKLASVLILSAGALLSACGRLGKSEPDINVPITSATSLAVPDVDAAQEMRAAVSEEVHTYASVGRVKWRFPAGFEYYFAHPHRTMGPRITCSSKRYECEISVLNRELPKATADRQEQLRQAMLGDDFNTTPVTVHSFGALQSVRYVRLTDPKKRYGRFGALGHGYRLMISGFAEKGPALISFTFYANDEAEFGRLFNIIEQAEAMDAVGVLAWRLGDLKAVCEGRFSQYTKANEAAFASSDFAGIDVATAVKTALSPTETADAVRTSLNEARAGFAKSFDDEGRERGEAICRTFPTVLSQAMSGISAGK